MNFWFIAALLVTVSLAVTAMDIDENLSDEEAWQQFQQSKQTEKRLLLKSTKEQEIRKQLFMTRLQVVRDHNKKFANGEATFEMGLNKLADYTTVELKKLTNLRVPQRDRKPIDSLQNEVTTNCSCNEVTTVKAITTTKKPTTIKTTATKKPTTIKTTTTKKPTTTTTKPTTTTANNVVNWDWRSVGAVNPIRDQGNCGSCWAFAAIASMEGAWFIKTGKLVELSEQQLVDCATTSYGCNGGWYDWAWNDVKSLGFMNASSYTYTGLDGVCLYDASKVIANISSFAEVPYKNEVAMVDAIRTYGPISVAIYASSQAFSYYKSGVYYDPTGCANMQINHAVTAVGYGTMNALDYYIVRNSWGTWWGMDGYILMARNKASHCGIADWGMYPVA